MKKLLITIVLITALSVAYFLPELLKQLNIKDPTLIIQNFIAFVLGSIAVRVIEKIKNSLYLVALGICLVTASCVDEAKSNVYNTSNDVKVIDVEGCQYVLYEGYKAGGITHKQNCRFCAERAAEAATIKQP